MTEHHATTYHLVDYQDSGKLWKVTVALGRVVNAVARKKAAEVTQGVMTGTFAGSARLGYFSPLMRSDYAVPDYASQFVLIAGDSVVGDGYRVPAVSFERGLNRELLMSVDGGWSVRYKYRTPWIRQIVEQLNFGGTLEYQPADFGEHFFGVVRTVRPSWCKTRG